MRFTNSCLLTYLTPYDKQHVHMSRQQQDLQLRQRPASCSRWLLLCCEGPAA